MHCLFTIEVSLLLKIIFSPANIRMKIKVSKKKGITKKVILSVVSVSIEIQQHFASYKSLTRKQFCLVSSFFVILSQLSSPLLCCVL